jgi:acetate kinase
MIILFDPNPPFLRWCKVEDGIFSENRCTFGPRWADAVIMDAGSIDRIHAIGYMLYNGGSNITSSANILSQDLLARVERCVGLLPEHNDITLKIAQYWIDKLPKIPHILFCDTAFFTDLPTEVSTYAIPYELCKKGIRRYGGYGLFHQWAWKKTQSFLNDQPRKLLSIYLGNHTNIAAIKNGMPLETTLGFSSLEGIPSSTGCGDIDTTIVFQLHSAGMSLEEINRLLSRESGFTGLLGKKCGFLDIVRNSDSEIAVVRDILCYNILKYAGAFISILGGVDSIAFLSTHIRESLNLISDICNRLEFLGLKCNTIQDLNEDFFRLSATDSRVEAYCMHCNQWKVMLEEAERLLKRGV